MLSFLSFGPPKKAKKSSSLWFPYSACKREKKSTKQKILKLIDENANKKNYCQRGTCFFSSFIRVCCSSKYASLYEKTWFVYYVHFLLIIYFFLSEFSTMTISLILPKKQNKTKQNRQWMNEWLMFSATKIMI